MDRTRRIPLLFAVVAGVLALGGPASLAAPAKKPDRQTVPGDLLVGFQSDVSTADQQKILKAYQEANPLLLRALKHDSSSNIRLCRPPISTVWRSMSVT